MSNPPFLIDRDQVLESLVDTHTRFDLMAWAIEQDPSLVAELWQHKTQGLKQWLQDQVYQLEHGRDRLLLWQDRDSDAPEHAAAQAALATREALLTQFLTAPQAQPQVFWVLHLALARRPLLVGVGDYWMARAADWEAQADGSVWANLAGQALRAPGTTHLAFLLSRARAALTAEQLDAQLSETKHPEHVAELLAIGADPFRAFGVDNAAFNRCAAHHWIHAGARGEANLAALRALRPETGPRLEAEAQLIAWRKRAKEAGDLAAKRDVLLALPPNLLGHQGQGPVRLAILDGLDPKRPEDWGRAALEVAGEGRIDLQRVNFDGTTDLDWCWLVAKPQQWRKARRALGLGPETPQERGDRADRLIQGLMQVGRWPWPDVSQSQEHAAEPWVHGLARQLPLLLEPAANAPSLPYPLELARRWFDAAMQWPQSNHYAAEQAEDVVLWMALLFREPGFEGQAALQTHALPALERLAQVFIDNEVLARAKQRRVPQALDDRGLFARAFQAPMAERWTLPPHREAFEPMDYLARLVTTVASVDSERGLALMDRLLEAPEDLALRAFAAIEGLSEVRLRLSLQAELPASAGRSRLRL